MKVITTNLLNRLWVNGIKPIKDGKIDISAIVNNLTTTAANKVLDARQGKILADKYDDLNSNINARQLKTYTDTTQIGITDNNTLQELCNVLPEKSVLFSEVGAKPSSGWKSQLPEGMGVVRIEKYYLSRIVIMFYPMNGGYFFQGAFSSNISPNLRPFVRYTGTAV